MHFDVSIRYVLVPHRWLRHWRRFVAGHAEPPPLELLDLETHVHKAKAKDGGEVDKEKRNETEKGEQGNRVWVPPPYVVEFIRGDSERKHLLPQYGIAGTKTEKSELNPFDWIRIPKPMPKPMPQPMPIPMLKPKPMPMPKPMPEP